MKIKMFIAGIFFSFFLTNIYADEATTYFIKGNKAYESGDFETAISNYEHVLQLKQENWQLYYNLGNAYFRNNNIGRAILNYERALKLQPDNEDIQFNLELAQLQTGDSIPKPPKEAWLVLLENWFNSPSFMFLFYTTLILYVLFMLGWALRYFVPVVVRFAAYRISFVFSIVLLIAVGSVFSLRWLNESTKHYGIILEDEVKVASAPAADAIEVFILHEGTKFRIQERSAQWWRIRLRDGKSGWIQTETAGEI
ncbi:MAG: tetratricopeptide repeat protein [Calditrichaeota bacterium]|nr:MAG: tetratricopeptide repeat protein [Calditrichota bacterium]